jgi:glycosyltransferase involved in cell wall biosynthesis
VKQKRHSLKKMDKWQVPKFNLLIWRGRTKKWCVVIPVINEGKRIKSLLVKMYAIKIHLIADIIIIDGGSTDNSLSSKMLLKNKVRGLLLKTDPGMLSAQLRCAYAFVMNNGYKGIITIDGNDKDDPAKIHEFIKALETGYDFVQASRFITGGIAKNTPKIRELAIRFIHAPLLRIASGFSWTDTTQGFRAYSRRLVLDENLSIFRNVFLNYELLMYLSYRAPKLKYRCIEIPTTRIYPKGRVPTKINGATGNLSLLKVLLLTCIGHYNPSP